jgi:hypothetical protein
MHDFYDRPFIEQLTAPGVEPDQRLDAAVHSVGNVGLDDGNLFVALHRLNALATCDLPLDPTTFADAYQVGKQARLRVTP